MPEDVEVETERLQELVSDLQEERAGDRRQRSWTRLVALSTSILSVFAAVGALEAGALVNEGLSLQLRATDTWNEYQADREKAHTYTVAANSLLDAGVRPTAGPAGLAQTFAPLPPAERLAGYVAEVGRENAKAGRLQREAAALERDSAGNMHRHHRFADAVAFLQVAISLGAVAVLLERRAVWALGLVSGAAGIVLFTLGWLGR